MPIYEYKCDECDNQFEELLLGSDTDPDRCPKCDAEGVYRVISNTSFQLKGGGWYVTDYKSDNSPASSDTESESKPAESGSESSDSSDSTGSSEKSGEESSSKPTATSGDSDDSSAA